MDFASKDWLKFALELYEKTKGMGLNENWGKKDLESLIDVASKFTGPSPPQTEKSENLQLEAGFAGPGETGDNAFWQQESNPPSVGTMAAGASKGSHNPPISIYESTKEVNIHVILPGVASRENLTLLLSPEMLELTGARTADGSLGAGNFYRTVRLPAPVEPAGTTATYRNGFLYIRAPKKALPSPLKIEVRFE